MKIKDPVKNRGEIILQLISVLPIFLWLGCGFAQERKTYHISTIAFYNVENFFDTENDPFTFDDDRTPEGKDIWNLEKYEDKLKNISKVISEIGKGTAKNSPAVIGLCEIENLKVLEDLINQPSLLEQNYGIVHFDSPDRRGVDVALLYQKSLFIPLNARSHRLMIYELDEPSKRVFTRDQLVVSGLFEGETFNFIVNHWPSRSGGETRSSYKRELAAQLNRRIIDSLHQIDPYAKIISLGDFNDDPTNKSIKKVLNTFSDKEKPGSQELFNPMEKMIKEGLGTLAYRDGWNLFDQIIFSQAFLNKDYRNYQFYKAGIFNPDYLITHNGQFRGYPFRSYDYGGYTGGYSDHFPVYVYLIKEEKGGTLPNE
jgi:exonuclease III